MSNKPDKEAILNKWLDQCFENGTLHFDSIGKILEAMDEFSASQNSELNEQIKKLQSTCLAAAEEIQSKWDAHCDNEGYGPANLMRRLENGIGDYYSGYNAGQFTKLQSTIEQKSQFIEKLKQDINDLYKEQHEKNNELEQMIIDKNKLLFDNLKWTAETERLKGLIEMAYIAGRNDEKTLSDYNGWLLFTSENNL